MCSYSASLSHNKVPTVGMLLGKPRAQHISRLRNAGPSEFAVLVRALHLPLRLRESVKLGVKMYRLLCAAAKLILARQQRGVTLVLRSSAAALSDQGGGAAGRSVHVNFAHMWDEVEVRLRWASDAAVREGAKSTIVQTMVQRGCVTVGLAQEGRDSRVFSEYWLCQPVEVMGTSAEAMYPALRAACPASLRCDDLGAMKEVARQLSHYTYMPLGDAASGNIRLMRLYASRVEKINEDPAVNGALLYWPELCGLHLHHRAKLQVTELRSHLMRHFSIANLHRLSSVQWSVAKSIEQIVARRLVRTTEEPPQVECSLHRLCDILFDWDAPHHRRKHGHSQRYQDLEFLCLMCNGDMSSHRMQHFCWCAASQAPCCASRGEAVAKTVRAIMHCMYSAADPIPAESRWTHMLANFKSSLLRKLVHSVGIDAFVNDSAAVAEAEDDGSMVLGEGEALDNFMRKVAKTRRQKVVTYYRDESNFHKLAILTNTVQVADSRLLYPLLGDAIHKKSRGDSSYLAILLAKDDGNLGRCLQELLKLFNDWGGADGPRRGPWLLLRAMRAPMEDPQLMRWARSQILRLSSALYRRYEARLACWPYPLFRLVGSGWTDEDKAAVRAALLDADAEWLDIYSRGVRKLFPSDERLQSAECLAMLRTDCEAHPWSIDSMERLNSELTHGHTKRAPARSLIHTARQALVRQAAVVHVARGGEEPLGRGALAAVPPTEVLHRMPLLPHSGVRGIADDVAAPTLADRPDEGAGAGAIVPQATPTHNR